MRVDNVDAWFKGILVELLDQPVTHDRTGVGTHVIPGASARFDLTETVPFLSLKQTPYKMGVKELLWMLSGSCDVADLPANMQHWWLPWCKDGSTDLGKSYGYQFGRGNQWRDLMSNLVADPMSRRNLISLWNHEDVGQCALPPCHGTVIQFVLTADMLLHGIFYQRSADTLVGLPINIAAYSVLTKAVALHLSNGLGELVRAGTIQYNIGNLHLYANHQKAAQELLTRKVKDCPTATILKTDLTCDKPRITFSVEGYNPHPKIDLPIAV